MSNRLPKPQPYRKPLQDTDLLRFVDAVIFGDQLQKLTPLELKTARESQTYRMMQRVGIAMYRAGEQGLRPKPQLMVVERHDGHEKQPSATEGVEDGKVVVPEVERLPDADNMEDGGCIAREGGDEALTPEQECQDHLSRPEA